MIDELDRLPSVGCEFPWLRVMGVGFGDVGAGMDEDRREDVEREVEREDAVAFILAVVVDQEKVEGENVLAANEGDGRKGSWGVVSDKEGSEGSDVKQGLDAF
jgi:hypothetical protein